MNKTLTFGATTMLIVEGTVLNARERQESRVQTRRHLGGGWSIGTDISYHGQFWLKLDSGHEVPVEGPGDFQVRQGHRVRILGFDSGSSLEAVALYNLTTQMKQYDDTAAKLAWQSGWWTALALLMSLAGIVLLLVGLLLWALSKRHGFVYMGPCAAVFGLMIAVEARRMAQLRRVVWAAME